MSAVIDFESLSLIPQLLKKMEALERELKEIKKEVVPELDLTKRNGVLKYLGISNSTLSLMMKDGRLKEGVHFKKVLNGKCVKLIFTSSAIVKYKESK